MVLKMKTRNMKGLSLPIEMIVIIAIAVLVLVVLAAFFIGSFKQTNSIGDTAALGTGCNIWKSSACTQSASLINIRGYDPDGLGTGNKDYPGDTLTKACSKTNYDPTADQSLPNSCKRYCGCPQ